jgi:hypothetical protein
MSLRVHRTMRLSALCVALLLVVSGGFVRADEADACDAGDGSCQAPVETPQIVNEAPPQEPSCVAEKKELTAALENGKASAALLARSNDENVELKTQLDTALDQTKQWQTKAVEFEGTVNSLRSQAAEIEQVSSGLSAEIAQLKPQLEAALVASKQWETKASDAEGVAAELRSKASEAEGVAAELRSKFEATTQATEGLPAKISELERRLAEALTDKNAAEEALEDFDRVITDAWLPHWLNRDIEFVRGELRQLYRAFVKVSRSVLDSWGVLERYDEFYAKAIAALEPHVAHVTDILIACYGRVVDKVDELKARWLKGRDNVVDLIKNFREAGKRRREHEASMRGLNPDRDKREDEKAAYSNEYWNRQQQRLGHLGQDSKEVWKFVSAKFGGWYGAGKTRVQERYTTVKTSYKHRVLPRMAQWRLALATHAKPLAERIVAKYPSFPPWVKETLGKVEFPHESADDVSIWVGDLLGYVLGAMGIVSVLYWTVFRKTWVDDLPDEASFDLKHVPAGDGTIVGQAIGGGADIKIVLPSVTSAADCDILVSDDKVLVNAYKMDDGTYYHEVKVRVPKECRGFGWQDGVDKWDMSAKFELKGEALTVSLRTPARALRAAKGAAKGDEIEEGEIIVSPAAAKPAAGKKKKKKSGGPVDIPKPRPADSGGSAVTAAPPTPPESPEIRAVPFSPVIPTGRTPVAARTRQASTVA